MNSKLLGALGLTIIPTIVLAQADFTSPPKNGSGDSGTGKIGSDHDGTRGPVSKEDLPAGSARPDRGPDAQPSIAGKPGTTSRLAP
jgi:hypothetical protein